MTKSPDETVTAWTRLLRAHTATLSQVEARLKESGLPPLGWYDVLLELERAGSAGLSASELERSLLLPQYGISRLLKRLEDAGYLSRTNSKTDGRSHVIRITAKGRSIRRRMWKTYDKAINEVIGDKLTRKQSTELATLLGKLY